MLGCTGLSYTILSCSSLYSDMEDSARTWWARLGCAGPSFTRLYLAILGHTGWYCTVLGCKALYLRCIGLHCII